MKIQLTCVTFSEYMPVEYRVLVDGQEVPFNLLYRYDELTGTETYTIDIPTLRAINPEARLAMITGLNPERPSAEFIPSVPHTVAAKPHVATVDECPTCGSSGATPCQTAEGRRRKDHVSRARLASK